MTNDSTSPRHVVLSGCSGGGKSTLLKELARRGFPIVSEPGRRIVEEGLRGEGKALPWENPAGFAKRAIEVASQDRLDMASATGWVFFDRGLVDAAVALQYATGQPARFIVDQCERYHSQVFLTPPWPEIYVTDGERRHRLDEAIAEHDRLLAAYGELGYETIILPKTGVGERVDFVLSRLR